MSERMRQPTRWSRRVRAPGRSHGAQGADESRLQGRWRLLARMLWWVLTAATLGLLGAGILVSLTQIQALCASSLCDEGQLSPDGLHALGRLGLSHNEYLSLVPALHQLHLTFSVYVWAVFIWGIISAAVFAAVAIIICWRRSDDRMALFTSLTLLMFGATFSSTMTALPQEYSAWKLPVNTIVFFGAVGFVTFFLLFPDGRFVPHWTRWVALAWAIAAIPTVVLPDSPLDLNTWPRIVTLAAQTGALGVGIWAQMYRYRRVDTRAQQVQTKWVTFGAAAAVVMAVCLNWAALPLLPTVKPGSSVTIVFLLIVAIITRVAFVVIPLSIGIAVVRHQLFDIDLIIKWTVVYGALTIALVLLYDGGSTVVEYTLLNLTGQGSVVAAVAASFVVGLLAHPLQRLIQNAVDRFLFRPQYVAERRIAAFSEKLRHEIDRDIAPEQLEQTLDHALGQAWATVEQHLPALHQIQHVRQHDD